MMFAPSNSAPVDHMPKVPLDIHASLVGSLFDDARSLIIGSVAATACIFLSAWKAGSWLLFAFALAVAIVAALRVRDMSAFAKIRSNLKTANDVRRWEIRYVVGATVTDGLIGFWCYASFTIVDDPFLRLLTSASPWPT